MTEKLCKALQAVLMSQPIPRYQPVNQNPLSNRTDPFLPPNPSSHPLDNITNITIYIEDKQNIGII